MRHFSISLRHPLVALVLSGVAACGHAQALPPGVRIGMDAAELPALVAGLTHVPKPVRLSGGLVGVWRGDAIEESGLRFEPTYFVAEGQLRRVEYAALASGAPDRGAAAFAHVLGWARARWGAERFARDGGRTQSSEIASWRADGDLDIYLQPAESPRQASVRLVYQRRRLKDASEL